MTDWNRQLFFLFSNADISTIHCGVGKLRNSCISLMQYENDMYSVLRSLCWWLRGLTDSFNLLSSIDGNAKETHPKGIYTRTRIFFTFSLVADSLIHLFYFYQGSYRKKILEEISCWLVGHLKFLEISSGSNKVENPLCKFLFLSLPENTGIGT